MEMIVADQIIMGPILDAGDAKQHIYQALSLAKDGKSSGMWWVDCLQMLVETH